MEIAKPGVPYACIAASTRASRPGGGSARAPVASNSPPAAMAAHRRSFVMVITLAPWIVRRLHLSFLAQREICFLPRPADFSLRSKFQGLHRSEERRVGKGCVRKC